MASSEAHRRGNAAAARASSVPWNDPNVDPPEDSADCPAPRWSIVSPRTRFAGRSDRSGGSSSVAEARHAAATAPPATARARVERARSRRRTLSVESGARRPRESVVVPRERLGVGVGGDLEPEVRERGRRPAAAPPSRRSRSRRAPPRPPTRAPCPSPPPEQPSRRRARRPRQPEAAATFSCCGRSWRASSPFPWRTSRACGSRR